MEPLYSLDAFDPATRADKLFIGKMLSTFLEQGAFAVEQLNKAVDNHDLAAAKAIVHSVKPGAAYLSMNALVSDMTGIEKWNEAFNSALKMLIRTTNEKILQVMEAIKSDIEN